MNLNSEIKNPSETNEKILNSNLTDSKFNSSLFDKSQPTNKIIFRFKIILLGDVAVGKTSIITRYIDNKFDNHYTCTINIQSRIKKIALNQEIYAEMSIWDTCGEEKFKALTRQYYRDTNGILLIFDLSNKKTFLNLKNWLNDIHEISPNDVNIILVGNKIDAKRDVSKEDINKFVEDNFLTYFEISAKNGINVDLAFEKLAREIVEKNQDFQNEINNINDMGDSIIDCQSSIHSGSIQLHDKSNIKNNNDNNDENNNTLRKFFGCC